MDYLEAIDYKAPDFGELYDELPLWSAPFGLLLLEQVVMRPGLTILDVGAGTGFLTIELAQRFGRGYDQVLDVGTAHTEGGPSMNVPKRRDRDVIGRLHQRKLSLRLDQPAGPDEFIARDD